MVQRCPACQATRQTGLSRTLDTAGEFDVLSCSGLCPSHCPAVGAERGGSAMLPQGGPGNSPAVSLSVQESEKCISDSAGGPLAGRSWVCDANLGERCTESADEPSLTCR